ncbi:MAG: hypothetical protein UV60_C0017G0006 [Parcubacteria group bacterium GW2011_GWA2_43_11]|nr:MAG: hypothetical protein UU89_C0042G0002 [Parcubacteria group bacterium GW2011_GWC2_42_11]KKS84664.1 MAG: hypothetical protein UV60_C0017G0006 [Parcubacteria group bacterium GW2011_GWA2_43_11]
MARLKDKEVALALRKQGKSYSEIKAKIGISKSTLSGWLHDYPLSKEELVFLRDKNPVRIEKYRATMAKKRLTREEGLLKNIRKDVGKISNRELLIAGMFLYWAEGTKRARYTTALTNTDPSMIRFFLTWLKMLKVPESKIGIRLQLYSDMDVDKEIVWWGKELQIKGQNFKKPYIKNSIHSNISYHAGYGHGTCTVLVHNRDLYEYVIMGITYLQELNGVSVEFNKT